jgi:hypothetical protein
MLEEKKERKYFYIKIMLRKCYPRFTVAFFIPLVFGNLEKMKFEKTTVSALKSANGANHIYELS